MKKFFQVLLVISLIVGVCLPALADDNSRVAIGNDIYISGDTNLQEDAVSIFGDQEIDGIVQGDAVAVFGDIEITGEVDSAVAIFGEITLKDGSKVHGDVTSVMGGVNRLGTTHVSGEVNSIGPGVALNNVRFNFSSFHWINPFWMVSSATSWFFKLIFAALITLLVLHFFSPNVEKMISVITEDPVQIGLKGLLWSVGIVIIGVIMAVTILGIPIAMLLFLAWWIAGKFGLAAIHLIIGKRVAAELKWDTTIYVNGIIGVAILSLLKAVPFVGGLIGLIVGLLALGAVMDTKFGTGKLRVK